MDIQFYAFTAFKQLVKVSTVFVFLGRGLLVQDIESQEDQYLFEISPFEYLNKFAIRLLFPVFKLSNPLYSLS